MELIGMLDSPYVRRVAISLQLLDLPFRHQSISVFRQFAQFQEINPVVKAPSLICDDGMVLMDSTLILEYAEAIAKPENSLMPSSVPALQRELQLIGLALAACEKSVQIIYERNLRPSEKLHQPWVDRVTVQLRAAFSALESQVRGHPMISDGKIGQAGITSAVAWHFAQQMVPELVTVSNYPALRDLSSHAEALPAFVAAPHGSGVFRNDN